VVIPVVVQMRTWLLAAAAGAILVACGERKCTLPCPSGAHNSPNGCSCTPNLDDGGGPDRSVESEASCSSSSSPDALLAARDGSAASARCQTCVYDRCNSAREVDNCEADNGSPNGCAVQVNGFYDCLKASDTPTKVEKCSSDFISNLCPTGTSQAYGHALVSCVVDTDLTKGCLTECGATAYGSDAGTYD
jgi:hypothetical protein